MSKPFNDIITAYILNVLDASRIFSRKNCLVSLPGMENFYAFVYSLCSFRRIANVSVLLRRLGVLANRYLHNGLFVFVQLQTFRLNEA